MCNLFFGKCQFLPKVSLLVQSMYISRPARCDPKSKMRTRPPSCAPVCAFCPCLIKAPSCSLSEYKSVSCILINRVGAEPANPCHCVLFDIIIIISKLECVPLCLLIASSIVPLSVCVSLFDADHRTAQYNGQMVLFRQKNRINFVVIKLNRQQDE